MTNKTTAIDRVLADQWAILPQQLEQICGIADHSARTDPVALAAELGRPLGNTRQVQVRDGVAMLPLEGSLFAKANAMTEHSGATSYDVFARDFTTALASDEVDSIVLVVDSPGGQVKGASELARMIYDARGEKPIVAYVEGMAASAAYWISAAADEIWAADTAQLGSIGVVAAVRQPDEDEGVYRFVSSQTPAKHQGADSPEGASAVQRNVDALADVFIDALSLYRSTPRSIIETKYGSGDVFVGAAAGVRGMIDGITTLENLHQKLRARARDRADEMNWAELSVEALAEHRPDIIAELREDLAAQAANKTDEAVKAETARVAGIMDMTQGLGIEAEAVTALIRDGVPLEDARAQVFEVLAAYVRQHGVAASQAPTGPTAQDEHTAALARAEAGLDAPTPSADGLGQANPSELDELVRVAKTTGAIKNG